jgi:hypothetical protein
MASINIPWRGSGRMLAKAGHGTGPDHTDGLFLVADHILHAETQPVTGRRLALPPGPIFHL